MSKSLNRAQILGNLGQSPETRSFPDGGKVASFTVATNESWTDKKTGEKKEKTEWHRVSVMGPGLVGVVEKYLSKGSKVLIEGQLSTRKWQDKDGQDRYTTEIVLRPFAGNLILLDAKDEGAAAEIAAAGGGIGGADDIPF